MDNNRGEKNIKGIIKLETRIAQCSRCYGLSKCTNKPSLGKGDLEPEALIVFESESDKTRDINWIVALRNVIQKSLAVGTIYHTFLVRCQPKFCPLDHINTCILERKLLNPQGICTLTNQPCNGIPAQPLNEHIINCLNFLMEEIEIMRPRYVVLYGQRVSDFVLRAHGILEPTPSQQVFKQKETTLIIITEDRVPGTIHIENQEYFIRP